jgi:hypothetical protein
MVHSQEAPLIVFSPSEEQVGAADNCSRHSSHGQIGLEVVTVIRAAPEEVVLVRIKVHDTGEDAIHAALDAPVLALHFP